MKVKNKPSVWMDGPRASIQIRTRKKVVFASLKCTNDVNSAHFRLWRHWRLKWQVFLPPPIEESLNALQSVPSLSLSLQLSSLFLSHHHFPFIRLLHHHYCSKFGMTAAAACTYASQSAPLQCMCLYTTRLLDCMLLNGARPPRQCASDCSITDRA
jgi:hypothetical protein